MRVQDNDTTNSSHNTDAVAHQGGGVNDTKHSSVPSEARQAERVNSTTQHKTMKNDVLKQINQLKQQQVNTPTHTMSGVDGVKQAEERERVRRQRELEENTTNTTQPAALNTKVKVAHTQPQPFTQPYNPDDFVGYESLNTQQRQHTLKPRSTDGVEGKGITRRGMPGCSVPLTTQERNKKKRKKWKEKLRRRAEQRRLKELRDIEIGGVSTTSTTHQRVVGYK